MSIAIVIIIIFIILREVIQSLEEANTWVVPDRLIINNLSGLFVLNTGMFILPTVISNSQKKKLSRG